MITLVSIEYAVGVADTFKKIALVDLRTKEPITFDTLINYAKVVDENLVNSTELAGTLINNVPTAVTILVVDQLCDSKVPAKVAAGEFKTWSLKNAKCWATIKVVPVSVSRVY